MVGTANVTGTAPAAPAVSGVDFTEYRVNGGAWTKGNSVTVSALGAQTVDYRSADKAGNVETAKSVAFTIKEKTVTPDRHPDCDPEHAGGHAGPDPGADGHAGARAQAVGLADQAQQDDGREVREERAEAPCHVHGRHAGRGHGHGLEQGPQGPQAQVRDAGQGHGQAARPASANVTLKPTKAMQRALAKIKQSVKVTVTLTVKPAGQPAIKATLNVTLARR